MLKRATAMGIVVLTLMAGLAFGADTYTETGDVGGLPGTAADLTGLAVDRILGNLDSGNADMFKIYISDPAAFSASTESATTDTELQLFDAFGMGIYANDDGFGTFGPSLLPAGHALSPSHVGVYFLSVSKWNNDPLSAGGMIFSGSYTDVMAPTGPGGGSPVIGWDGDGTGGPYEITLTGVGIMPTGVVVPAPGAALLVCIGLGLSRGVLGRSGRKA